MLETEAGRLEARVSVKNGEVSDPDYYLRDKRLEKTPDAKIYVRVSTDRQTVENQIAALSKVAKARGWQIVATFRDERH